METRTSGVPTPAPHELRRERLLEVLHKHRGQPLILLVAAAGFGKSTLAATYARDSGAAVVWLTLQPADRDTRRLFTRLAGALEAGFGEPGSIPELRRGLDEGAEGVGLARLLLTDLAQAPAGFIIILDDFHSVSGTEDVTNSIDALIRELPEAGQVVITAREPPATLSMTQLVVQGAVFALGTEDLRFSPEETRALRKLRSGDAPAEEQATMAARDEQAEGWVAGILLGGAPRQLNVGGGSLLGGYVEREVLDPLSTTEQGWLEMLSVFDTITVRAAERVLGPGPWQSRLLGLTERCPFLVAGQDGTYRLHALVRETVLNRLRRSPDDRATTAWTVARQLAEEASDAVAVVRACQELGQIDGAIELVRRAAIEAVQAGRWPAVLVTLELLPEALRRGHPDLSLIEARALHNTGHQQRAHDAAEAALQHGGRTGDVAVQIAALVELAMATYTSDMSAAEDWLSAADHLVRSGDQRGDGMRYLEGKMLGVRGICATLRGEIGAAREAFETGQRLLSLLGPSRELALIQQNFGSFCNRTGQYADAQKALASAASHWRLMGDRNGLATTQTILGDLHLRLGNLGSAGAELNDAVAAARSVGALRIEAHAVYSVGQWHRANGRINDAIVSFEEGLRLAEETVDRELLAEALASRAEIALLQNEVERARELLTRAQAQGQRVGSNEALATVDRALGRLHLVDGAMSRAVGHFDDALKHGGVAWGPDERASTLYWLGSTYLTLGRAQEASDYLEQAIAVAESTGSPALLAGPAAEDPRLLLHGREIALNPIFLAEVERLSTTRRPWSGINSNAPVTVVAHNDLPRVEVKLFGSFALHRDGQLVSKATRKVDRARELAALLVLHPKGLADETIAELMFPDMPRESALHNLQMAAYSLRKDLSKAAVRYGARTYQLNPQLELHADVRAFDASLAKARGATGDALLQALTRAVELYRGPLLADAAWHWLEPVRLEYRAKYVSAAVQLADALAPLDAARSDGLAEEVLAVAPETDLAFERLIRNARQRRDATAIRRLVKRYEQAAAQFDFPIDPYLMDDQGSSGRAAR